MIFFLPFQVPKHILFCCQYLNIVSVKGRIFSSFLYIYRSFGQVQPACIQNLSLRNIIFAASGPHVSMSVFRSHVIMMELPALCTANYCFSKTHFEIILFIFLCSYGLFPTFATKIPYILCPSSVLHVQLSQLIWRLYVLRAFTSFSAGV